jgi:hypothetical protein
MGEQCGLALHPNEAFQTCTPKGPSQHQSCLRVILTCPEGGVPGFPRSHDLVLDRQTRAVHIRPILSEKSNDQLASDR